MIKSTKIQCTHLIIIVYKKALFAYLYLSINFHFDTPILFNAHFTAATTQQRALLAISIGSSSKLHPFCGEQESPGKFSIIFIATHFGQVVAYYFCS
jgi:hypothetical protein